MTRHTQTDLFGGEAAVHEPAAVGPAMVPDALALAAARLPAHVRLGTSSWSFPGWKGLVYDGEASAAQLARKGLIPYAAHPLLRAVGLDRTYYGPLPASALREYAQQVPDDFRFLVKADRRLSFPTLAGPLATSARWEAPPSNPDFLNAAYACEHVVGPVVEGMGAKLGALLFQFPPLPLGELGGAEAVARRLGHFLDGLPAGPTYAVEVRNAELLCDPYLDALRRTGTAHCYTVHSAMPDIATQRERVPLELSPLLIVRWMLGHGLKYEEAKEEYEPFDHLVRPDATSRSQIAAAIADTIALDRDTLVIANNKAEGSSPLSVFELAKAVVARVSGQ